MISRVNQNVFITVLASEDHKSLPEIHVSPFGFTSDRHLFGNICVKCDPVLSSSPSECESRRCTPATMLDINTTPINFTFEHLILRHRSVAHKGILRTKLQCSSCSATSVLSVSRYQPITFLPGGGTPRRLITQLRLPFLQPGTLGTFLILSWRTKDACLQWVIVLRTSIL